MAKFHYKDTIEKMDEIKARYEYYLAFGYQVGTVISKLAKEFNLPYSNVYRYLHESGVVFPPRKRDSYGRYVKDDKE